MSIKLSSMQASDILREAAKNENLSFLDARILLFDVLNCSHAEHISNSKRQLSPDELQVFEAVLTRRLKGEPVSQIIGFKEFWGLEFKVTKDVLTPRPDSETLIEVALSLVNTNKPITILDLGTGSGCLLTALLHELPLATGVAVDKSAAALKIAAHNFDKHGLGERVELVQADFTVPLEQRFDLVISNPPYIPESDRSSLAIDVRDYEPEMALFAGDGLEAYRAITPLLPSYLKNEGCAIFEVGKGQADDVTGLVQEAFKEYDKPVNHKITNDLAGVARVVSVQLLG